MNCLGASYIETQFYLARELHPTAALNTITRAVGIRGLLVPQQLAHALQQLSLRHMAMRTRFQIIDGAIARIIDDEAPKQPLDIREEFHLVDCDVSEGGSVLPRRAA